MGSEQKEAIMARRLLIVALASVLGTGVAYAQEGAGAGRIEGGIYPAGAIFFPGASDDAEPGFGQYTFGGWGGYNFNRHWGVTSEIGIGVARRQDMSSALGQFADVKTPVLANYSGNAVFHPRGNDRALVPYVTGGLGGLTLYHGHRLSWNFVFTK
jgi:hypothetical protein